MHRAPASVLALLPLCLAWFASSTARGSEGDDPLMEKARALAQRFLIVDGHIDVPYRMTEHEEDISVRTPGGDFDYPRAMAGGLNSPFMSIFTPASKEKDGGSKPFALDMIDMVRGFETAHPDKFRVVASVAEVDRAKVDGVMGLLMGMENGSPIEGDLANVDLFHELGIRYITLCHSLDNHICDSSYDTSRTHGGLTPFGHEVVKRMNEVGIIIDVSHISDDSFYQVMELSKAPVFASHSSTRHFTPGFERNMSDLMIRKLAEKDGVILINFGSTFIDGDLKERGEREREELRRLLEEQGLSRRDDAGKALIEKYREDHPAQFADVSLVADHIEHVIKLVGVDHVGFGSDFDGVGDSLPTGLKDVSMYPNLIRILLERGHSDDDIEKICGKNAMRILAGVERVAAELGR